MDQDLPLRPDLTKYPDQAKALTKLIARAGLSDEDRLKITASATDLVVRIRDGGRPGLMEVFLAEYGLSTEEGIALMCLAEALLRVPDPETIDALIEDKIAPSDWGRHLGQSSSPLVNASTWALLLTGRVLDEAEPGIAGAIRGAIKRLGEPVIRRAARQAMREMGQQFVLGQTMPDALDRARGMEAKGYTYSYDMLGEAARTAKDADRYAKAYANAIRDIANAATGDDIRSRPGISIKLSALHPRYEVAQSDRVLSELAPRVADLAAAAAAANIGLNIDAEEADRLELSLDVIEQVLQDSRLEKWDGFGVVVQAYGPRAPAVIDHLYALAERFDRRMMVRLVKGAYWDTEIKHAQTIGAAGFPVFTSKAATDISYIACARQLIEKSDRIYPQFATHNAHSVAAILYMNQDRQAFEFQRLHGMGERLHDLVLQDAGTRCRIYAPVGAHRDLLAYLVRRLLENGANSSFVNQIVDEDVPPAVVAEDPFARADARSALPSGPDLYQPARANSKGWDLTDTDHLAAFDDARAAFAAATWTARPLLTGPTDGDQPTAIRNPANPEDVVGLVHPATPDDVETAISAARPWLDDSATRARILNTAADLYEENAGEIFALLAREAGKTPLDAVGELREAVDFLRYYASQTGEVDQALGVVTAISPWNFPLAIFTGQIAGALAAGNGVLAKPAEQTPLIAHLATRLMRKAGVPAAALQLLPGDGAVVGRALTSDARIAGVAFTGSTDTALTIRRAMADHLPPSAPLLAETGGLNAMIIDSTALLEQAVRDVVQSAFQSAGQRCSALRCVYVQADIADAFKEMLFGAMDELRLGAPWALSTDVGPVIDEAAHAAITNEIHRAGTRVLKALPTPPVGLFVPPTVIAVDSIADLKSEIFGPVLHLATFEADALEKVVSDINTTGYGLTFGLHTRIDSRVQEISDRIRAGNVYVNRNQIGAVVGTQPFGGEGLSGTGPKAGGPAYIHRFTKSEGAMPGAGTDAADVSMLQAALSAQVTEDRILRTEDMPGPTGEANRLTEHPRLPLLCLGPGAAAAEEQRAAVEALGTPAIAVTGTLKAEALIGLTGFGGVIWWGDADAGRAIARALAARNGPILPLITGLPRAFEVRLERHLCVDTTASGGNAQLLAEVAATEDA